MISAGSATAFNVRSPRARRSRPPRVIVSNSAPPPGSSDPEIYHSLRRSTPVVYHCSLRSSTTEHRRLEAAHPHRHHQGHGHVSARPRPALLGRPSPTTRRSRGPAGRDGALPRPRGPRLALLPHPRASSDDPATSRDDRRRWRVTPAAAEVHPRQGAHPGLSVDLESTLNLQADAKAVASCSSSTAAAWSPTTPTPGPTGCEMHPALGDRRDLRRRASSGRATPALPPSVKFATEVGGRIDAPDAWPVDPRLSAHGLSTSACPSPPRASPSIPSGRRPRRPGPTPATRSCGSPRRSSATSTTATREVPTMTVLRHRPTVSASAAQRRPDMGRSRTWRPAASCWRRPVSPSRSWPSAGSWRHHAPHGRLPRQPARAGPPVLLGRRQRAARRRAGPQPRRPRLPLRDRPAPRLLGHRLHDDRHPVLRGAAGRPAEMGLVALRGRVARGRGADDDLRRRDRHLLRRGGRR